MKCLFAASLVIGLCCGRTNATVIFYVYHAGAVFIGSDSLVTGDDSQNYRMDKVGCFTDTCAVSIAHSYGTGQLFLPSELAKICNATRPKDAPLQMKINQVASEFQPICPRPGHIVFEVMKTKSRKLVDNPDQTRGSKLAAEVRKKANSLSPKQRADYFRKGMAMIHGGAGSKEASPS